MTTLHLGVYKQEQNQALNDLIYLRHSKISTVYLLLTSGTFSPNQHKIIESLKVGHLYKVKFE